MNQNSTPMHTASVLVGRYDLPLFHQPHASTLKCTCPRLAFYTPELKLLSQMCKESNLQSLQDRIKCGKPIRAVQPNYDTLIKCGWFTTFYSLHAPFLALLWHFSGLMLTSQSYMSEILIAWAGFWMILCYASTATSPSSSDWRRAILRSSKHCPHTLQSL